MAARSSSHATLNGDLSSSNISRLESLPAEVVTAIGNHLDLADLGLFRKTSKTMCERLNFNLKKYVKVIRYWPMQPMFDALSKFQTQPLAKAMDSCIWLRIITLDPPGEDESEEEFLDLDNSSNEEEIRRDSQDAAFLPASPALPDSDQKRLIPLSLSGFPSLKITRTWILAFGLLERGVPQTNAVWQGIKASQISFDCVPILEEVAFQECTIDGPRLDGIPVVTENGELRKELRRLNFAGCNFERPNRSQMEKFFGALRSYGRLQDLHFEAGRGFTFDWNRSGLEDDRAQLLTDNERHQIWSALNAMDPYVRA
ncbi:hypothetical protein IWX49DRAFT_549860 [Phyllosticta citricarpa]